MLALIFWKSGSALDAEEVFQVCSCARTHTHTLTVMFIFLSLMSKLHMVVCAEVFWSVLSTSLFMPSSLSRYQHLLEHLLGMAWVAGHNLLLRAWVVVKSCRNANATLDTLSKHIMHKFLADENLNLATGCYFSLALVSYWYMTNHGALHSREFQCDLMSQIFSVQVVRSFTRFARRTLRFDLISIPVRTEMIPRTLQLRCYVMSLGSRLAASLSEPLMRWVMLDKHLNTFWIQ